MFSDRALEFIDTILDANSSQNLTDIFFYFI